MRNALTIPSIIALGLFVGATSLYAAPDLLNSYRAEAIPVRQSVQTGISWKVTPDAVKIYLNGKLLGRAKDINAKDAKPNQHTQVRPGKELTIRLVNEGDKGQPDDEVEMVVKVDKGQILTVVYDF